MGLVIYLFIMLFEAGEPASKVCVWVPNHYCQVMVCDIRIFISIRYQYDNGVNIEISIQFLIIFNCVGGVIAWAADIYKYS